jgi:hypothetical protein
MELWLIDMRSVTEPGARKGEGGAHCRSKNNRLAPSNDAKGKATGQQGAGLKRQVENTTAALHAEGPEKKTTTTRDGA